MLSVNSKRKYKCLMNQVINCVSDTADHDCWN